MKRQQQQAQQSEYSKKYTGGQTTYTSLLPQNQFQLSSINHKRKFLQVTQSQKCRSIKQQSNQTESIGSSTSSRKAVSVWLQNHPHQIRKKTFQPRLASFLLPKLHITNFKNLNYQFQLPSQKPKYPYAISDKQLFDQALINRYWKGIEVNVHINSLFTFGDILVTLLLFTLSAFQALLYEFTNYQTQRISVRLLTNFCLGFLILRNIIQCIKITTYHRRLIYRLQDIIVHRLTQPVFYIDCTLIVILCINIQHEEVQSIGVLLYLVSFLKSGFLTRNFYILERIYFSTYREIMMWNILKIMILNIFFTHFFATVLISLYYINTSKNWITKFKIQNRPWYQIYIWAFYFAAGILPNTGFGDITPVIYQEAIIIGLFKLLTFGFWIFIDMFRLDYLLGLKKSLEKRIGIFRQQAKNDRISNQLKQKIEYYLKRASKDDTNLSYRQRVAFLGQLPQSLQKKYLSQFSQNRLRSLPFFRLLGSKTLMQLCLKIYDRIYYPGNMILKSALRRPDKISILKIGKISFLCRKYQSKLNGTPIHVFEVNPNKQELKYPFLIDQLFIQRHQVLNYDVKAEKQSKVLHINLQDFFQVIKQNQFDREYVFELYHRHKLFPNEWTQVKCNLCQTKFHTMFNCPKIHFIPAREVVFLKNTQPERFRLQNKRNIIYHRKRSKFRQKEKWNRFFKRDMFKKIEQQLGISSYNKTLKNLKLKRFKISSQSQQIPQFSHHDRFSLQFEAQSEQSPQIKMQKVNSLKEINQQNKNNFFDRQYLYKQNRQIEQTGQQSYLRHLKNMLFDLITQTLQPELHGFWDIEIDKMHNFKNYFKKQNPDRFSGQTLSFLIKPESTNKQ